MPPKGNNVSLGIQFAPSTLDIIFGSGSMFGDDENTSDVLDNTDWGNSGNTASAESMGIDMAGIFIDIDDGGTGFSSGIVMDEGPGGAAGDGGGDAAGGPDGKGNGDDSKGTVVGHKGDGKGNDFRGGKQKDRDRDMEKYPTKFKKWYHQNKGDYVLPRQSDPNLDPIYKEWKDLGEPSSIIQYDGPQYLPYFPQNPEQLKNIGNAAATGGALIIIYEIIEDAGTLAL